MRLSLRLAVLTLIPVSLGSQIPLQPQPIPVVQSTTLINALSADSNYTRLLRLLQRTRLVPTLNRLNGSTLFAPTNDAIQQNQLWSAASGPDDAHATLADNIQETLRQQLFYHLLNTSVASLPSGSQPEVLKTLHFPQISLEPPSKIPPPNLPWIPKPDGSLGGQPQRLRWAAREDNTTWVGTDHVGNGGIQIVRPAVDAGNGILWGINGVLEPPGNLSYVISQHNALSFFQGVLPAKLKNLLVTSPQLTLFLPNNSAWDALDPVEKQYLSSGYADDDLQKVLDMHSVKMDAVMWSDTFKESKQLTTVSGDKLKIEVSQNGTNVSSASLLQPDIYASNGVLHIVSSLLIPSGSLQLTPEKYLLGLNCTTFVSLLRSVSLGPLVNSTNASYTILAPRDDVISLGGENNLPERGSAALARVLRYHFLPGRWTPKKLRDGMLVQTALMEDGLGGGPQVLGVGVAAKGDNRELTFGGASVISGTPVEINNTIIYFISRALIPPVDALEMALPYLQFSMFLASVFSTSLANRLRNATNTTLLIPQNPAFERLGLVTTHLLTAKSDLEHVILHHVMNEVAYLDSIQNGSQLTYGTLDGSDVHVARTANKTVLITPSGGWDGLKGNLVSGNVLTKTGVIHELSSVLLPRSIDITIDKLARAAKGTTMASLVVKAGMQWILNGTSPPDDSEWAEAGLTDVGWTLLCPTDDSFKGVNMSRLWEDMDGMRQLVLQHLIPVPSRDQTLAQSDDANRPIYMDGSATYSTLLSRISVYGDVVFRQSDSKNPQMGYLVGIKGARGTNGESDWANVLSWGRSTTGGRAGGVVQIDRLLMPYRPSLWVHYGPPAAVGVVGLALMAGFFWFVAYLWRRESVEATYEPVGGFDREDDD